MRRVGLGSTTKTISAQKETRTPPICSSDLLSTGAGLARIEYCARWKLVSGDYYEQFDFDLRLWRADSEHQAGPRTQAEVAAILSIGERTVRELERSAFAKLRHHPKLRELWREWLGIEEGNIPASAIWDLTPSEIRALLDLAANQFERWALKKLIALTHV